MSGDAAAKQKARDKVIADVFARIALGELRSLPMTTRQRVGAFMLAAIRSESRICAIALDNGGALIGEKHFDFGPRWEVEALADTLASFAIDVGAEHIIIGMSLRIRWENLAPLDMTYRLLKAKGVTLVDLIEVADGASRSIFKRFTPGKRDVYDEFEHK